MLHAYFDEMRCCLHQWHTRALTLGRRKVAVLWLKGRILPVQAALAYDLAAVKFRGRSAATNYDVSAFERELAQLDEVRPSFRALPVFDCLIFSANAPRAMRMWRLRFKQHMSVLRAGAAGDGRRGGAGSAPAVKGLPEDQQHLPRRVRPILICILLLMSSCDRLPCHPHAPATCAQAFA